MSTTRRSLVGALVLLGCLMGSASGAATATDVRSETSASVDAWVEQRMAAHGIPGAAVAVVSGGQVEHLAGYGMADPDGTPVTPDTAFLIGSVSKPVTAALIGQLVAGGLVEWDEPVWPHLAHLADDPPAAFEHATAEQLLTHTAGLRMSVGVAGAVDVHEGPDALERRVRDLLSKQLAFEPGTGWEYSNAGPTLLAAVVEQVTGRPFAEELRDRVFDPLGMTGAFATAEAAASAPLATGHALWFGRWRPVEHTYDEAGTAMGWIGASAADLAVFMQAHLDGHPAVPATARQVAEGPVHATGWDVALERSYGRGWFVDELAGHTVISHTGSLGHFTAHVILVPDEDLGVAVLTNASAIIAAGHDGQYDLSLGLVGHLLGESPVSVSRALVLTYLAPALAWVACILVAGLVLHLPRSTMRTRRRRMLALLLLGIGGALLAAPLGTARHFYPDVGWALSLLTPLALSAGLVHLIPARRRRG